MQEPNTPQTFKARVSGSVQGVGFRAWTLFEFRRRGVNGYVRNLPDGSVEVVAFLEPGKSSVRGRLDELLALLKRGPPEANVVSVDLELPGPNDPPGDVPCGFEIRF